MVAEVSGFVYRMLLMSDFSVVPRSKQGAQRPEPVAYCAFACDL